MATKHTVQNLSEFHATTVQFTIHITSGISKSHKMFKV